MATGKTGVVIPTGYEQFQRAAEEKRQIAKAMLAQGMQPLNNPTSWAQVLGQWAQSFAGNRMLRKADQMDDQTNQQILGDYGRRTTELTNDAQTMAPEAFVPKWSNDPMLRDHPLVKSMTEAYTANQKKRYELPDKPKPTDQVIVVDGQVVPNGPAIAARRAANGFGTEGFPQSAPWPFGGQASAPQQSAVQDPQGLMAAAAAVGRNPAVSPSVIGQVPPPAGKTADGRDVWLIGGKYYDNPEGK